MEVMESVTAEVVRAARQTLEVRRILLFGSRAAGTAAADSDHDFLIVADSDLSPNDRIDLVRSRLLHVREPLDIFVVTPEEFERLRSWTSTVIHEASVTGKVVYEAA
ncbi:MAG: nucleotidyltransferase domain-containing protein [Deltaproteobacteria bacterium]|nr:nucleotidyltransferase domain-containing protein [Deltaproteobacteria bacterium]